MNFDQFKFDTKISKNHILLVYHNLLCQLALSDNIYQNLEFHHILVQKHSY